LTLAASIVLATGVLAWATFEWAPWGAGAAEVLTTKVGENRTVLLADGSKVTLGGSTKIEITFTDNARSLELERGEAFFAVAKDAARPFKVRAGDTAVIAVGTEFNVRRGSDRVVVAVTQGRVVVEPVSRIVPLSLLREFKPKLAPVHVDAGEQTIAGDTGIEEATPVKDLAAATAWQTGRLAFRLQPLRYVLEDVNRYTAKPIVIEDESIGSLVITGTVIGGDVEEWIGSLEQAFGLEAIEEPERIVVRRRVGSR
jgi:transmembrane sensor